MKFEQERPNQEKSPQAQKALDQTPDIFHPRMATPCRLAVVSCSGRFHQSFHGAASDGVGAASFGIILHRTGTNTHTPIRSVTWQPKSLWQSVVWLFPAGSSSVSGLVVPATLVATRICSGLKWAWVCVWVANSDEEFVFKTAHNYKQNHFWRQSF